MGQQNELNRGVVTSVGGERQLLDWIAGVSHHNQEHNQCCPDFSCCCGIDLQAPLVARQRFLQAYKDGDYIVFVEMIDFWYCAMRLKMQRQEEQRRGDTRKTQT